MLVMNLWTKAGLVNGTQGIVVACIADEAANKPPLAVLVRFPHYSGPRFPGLPATEEWRCVVPITAFTTTFFKSGTSCSRTQIPLALAWAVKLNRYDSFVHAYLTALLLLLGHDPQVARHDSWSRKRVATAYVGTWQSRIINWVDIRGAIKGDEFGLCCIPAREIPNSSSP